MQPNGGLYKDPNGKVLHGNGREIEKNPEPGQPTMTNDQYNDFVKFVIEEE